MLESTFCHIPGIGRATERALWDAGVLTWSDAARLPASVSARRARLLADHLDSSLLHTRNDDPRHFYDALPPAEHWRLFSRFRHATAYLDIETTGLGPDYNHITTIALYDGSTVRHYVHGRNLDDFVTDIAAYKLIVTYNGKSFDVPFIEKSLRTRIDQAHIDLRHVLGSLGYKGGLKVCEQRLGYNRGELEGVDGYFGVLLWYDYENNHNPRALDTLLAYNVQDAINLESLMVIAYNRKIAATPFVDTYKLEVPDVPANPFRADAETIARIRAEMGMGPSNAA